MIKVDQEIIDIGRGDCFRAAVASVLNLELIQVPHFNLFNERWSELFIWFLEFLGWESFGVSGEKKDLLLENSFEGYFIAVVNSKTHTGIYHSVIIDKSGIVVHDPNPNKKWLGINIVETDQVHYWYLVSRKEI